MEIEQVIGTLCGGNISLKDCWHNVYLDFTRFIALKMANFKHHFDSTAFMA